MSEKVVTVGGRSFDVAVERDGTRFRAGEREIEVLAAGDEELRLLVDGAEHRVPFAMHGTALSFAFDGAVWFADVADRGARVRPRHRDHSTAAPMPGLVLKLLVAEGAVVTRGTPLLILEAMKMEHQIVAPVNGTVSGIRCTEGEMVQPGVELVEIEESAEEDGPGA